MIEHIESSIDALSGAERRVAEWVLREPRTAAESTLAQVSRLSGASEATVVRFSRSIGLRGFRELTLRLAESIGRLDYLHQDVLPGDSKSEVAVKVVEAAIRDLNQTLDGLGDQPLDQVVQIMAGARQLIFAGLGASGQVAQDARHKFFRLGIPCVALNSAPDILQQSAVASPNDVFFFISSSGKWRELSVAATRVGERGGDVVSMTRSDSVLAKSAGYVLHYRSHEDTTVFTPLSSRLSQIALLDVLFVLLAQSLGKPAMERLRQSKFALENEVGQSFASDFHCEGEQQS